MSITINHARREVFKGKDRIHLSPKEFEILAHLRETERAMTRDDLKFRIWGKKYVDGRAIDQQVARLRRKLGKGVIRTVPSWGYCIEKGVKV